MKLGDTEINFTFYSGLSVPPKAEDGSEWFGVLPLAIYRPLAAKFGKATTRTNPTFCYTKQSMVFNSKINSF